jgi:bifunctional non-homologous end joining protein LigD
VLNGELAVTDELGRPVFVSVMRRRELARYFAFDLLWLDGEDLRGLPLLERKARLARLLPRESKHILYVDHVEGSDRMLFEAAKALDLEGIVAKLVDSRYTVGTGQSPWIKIKNPDYTQKLGRHELFDRRRAG